MQSDLMSFERMFLPQDLGPVRSPAIVMSPRGRARESLGHGAPEQASRTTDLCMEPRRRSETGRRSQESGGLDLGRFGRDGNHVPRTSCWDQGEDHAVRACNTL